MRSKYENISEFLDDILDLVDATIKDNDENEPKKEAVKKEVKKEYTKPKVEVKECEAPCEDSCKKEPKEYKEYKEVVPGNITIDNNDHYILNEMVNGWPTYNEQHLIFEQFTEEGYKVPGITEAQLLAVLYNRYKNNPKKLDLVRQLMN